MKRVGPLALFHLVRQRCLFEEQSLSPFNANQPEISTNYDDSAHNTLDGTLFIVFPPSLMLYAIFLLLRLKSYWKLRGML